MIIETQATLQAEDSISLARYAKIIGNPECSFWGVRNPNDPTNGECRAIWSKQQRDTILKALSEAQLEIESVIGYFLAPHYVVGRLADEPSGNDRYVDEQPIPGGWKLHARWPKIIALGQGALSDIALASAVNHATDPAVVGPIITTVTDVSEVHVYHPGTYAEIDPSRITIVGGAMTIYIPRCRMVLAAKADNPDSGWEYTDLANFEAAVDVKRLYTDPTVNATLAWKSYCGSGGACAEETQTACLYVEDAALGLLSVRPASYSSGAWLTACLSGCVGSSARVRLCYLSGASALSLQAEDAIVRLAHAKMPDEPCGCEGAQRLWRRDRNVPEVLTRERINCPFGMNDGAWIAWRFSQSPSMRVMRASVL